MLLMNTPDDETGCRRLAASGKVVVLKRGASGCTVYSQDVEDDIPGFYVEEVDPTGAGDTFCAGFYGSNHGRPGPTRGWAIRQCRGGAGGY